MSSNDDKENLENNNNLEESNNNNNEENITTSEENNINLDDYIIDIDEIINKLYPFENKQMSQKSKNEQNENVRRNH